MTLKGSVAYLSFTVNDILSNFGYVTAVSIVGDWLQYMGVKMVLLIGGFLIRKGDLGVVNVTRDLYLFDM